MRPGPKTRRLGQAVERQRWKRGSDTEEGEQVGTVQHRRRSPRGGAKGGALDLATAEPSTPARIAEQWIDMNCGGVSMVCVRVNPNRSTILAPFYTPVLNPSP
jgi:hypothetical protein